MDMNESRYPCESSPLLHKTSSSIRDAPVNKGFEHRATSLSSSNHERSTNNGTFDTPLPKEPTVNAEEIERQSIEERQTEYEGLPEVKKKLKYIFPAIAIGVFLSAADQTLIVSAYGRIGSELNALNQTSWIATSYFLTLTCFQPLYGKLSDIFGRKSCLLFGYTIFGIGCLGCGLSRDINQLIAARAFAGIGGSAMTTVVSILFSDIFTLRERGQWQGYINIIYAAGASAGAPLGGFAADYLGWRWAFLVQTPMCLLAFIAVALALHLPSSNQTGNLRKRFLRIDFLGAAMLIGAVFTLLLAFDRGSNDNWSSPITLSALGLSALLWAAFLIVETRVASEPLAPGRIIFDRTLVACYACNFFSMAGWLSTIFYVPMYFQTAMHATATSAGLLLIPSIFTSVLGSLFAGWYMRKTGRFYTLTVLAYATLAIGIIIVFLFSGPVMDSTIGILTGMSIGGFGNGTGITTTLIGLIAHASRDDQAVATACSYLFRSLGSTFGISLSATVANIALRQNLATRLPGMGMPEGQVTEIAQRVRESLTYRGQLDSKVRTVVEDCFKESTNAAFGLQIVLVVGAAVSACYIREKTLSK